MVNIGEISEIHYCYVVRKSMCVMSYINQECVSVYICPWPNPVKLLTGKISLANFLEIGRYSTQWGSLSFVHKSSATIEHNFIQLTT